jgi:hypothetical protein
MRTALFISVSQKIADLLWVLLAYYRGKLLRQPAYLPRNFSTSEKPFMSFPKMPSETSNRRRLLIRCWGYKSIFKNWSRADSLCNQSPSWIKKHVVFDHPHNVDFWRPLNILAHVRD